MPLKTELQTSPPPVTTASKGHIVGLRAGMTPHAALQSITEEILRHLQNNVPGIILTPEDPEFIHQARVALRRLRSAHKSFGRILPDKPSQTLPPEIKWLATLLGEARDLDVLLTETLPTIATAFAAASAASFTGNADTDAPDIDAPDIENTDSTDFSPLANAATHFRSKLQQRLRTALTSKRYETLLLRLEELQHETRHAPALDKKKLSAFARRSLNENKRRVHRLARQWHTLDREQRHDLRKRIKKLRYSAEFFSSLYKRKSVDRYLEKLAQLQKSLGTINDAFATQKIIALLRNRDPALRYPAGLIAGWQMCEAKHAEADMEQRIKELMAAKPFW